MAHGVGSGWGLCLQTDVISNLSSPGGPDPLLNFPHLIRKCGFLQRDDLRVCSSIQQVLNKQGLWEAGSAPASGVPDPDLSELQPPWGTDAAMVPAGPVQCFWF